MGWNRTILRERSCRNDIQRLPQLGGRAAYFKQALHEKLIDQHYIREHGDDMPEIAGWRWDARGAAGRFTSTKGDNV